MAEQVFDAGLCAHCRFCRITQNDRGSTFYQCLKSFEDPRFEKYPRLPVRICDGYRPAGKTPVPRT